MAKIFSQSVQKKRMPLIGFGDLMGDNFVSKKMKTNLCVLVGGDERQKKKINFSDFPLFLSSKLASSWSTRNVCELIVFKWRFIYLCH